MFQPRLLNQTLGLIPWSLRARIKRLPGLARLQREVVRRALDGKRFVHRVDAGPAKGIRFEIQMPDDKGIWTGTYEIEFARRLARAVVPGRPAFDIGSWHGFFSGVMAAQGASETHAFEPLPTNRERLRRLVELNPDKRINVHECAVGKEDGELDLLVMAETSMAKLETSSFHTDEDAMNRIRVPVRSIDSMISAGVLPTPALIKIDVEGAEVAVLQGAMHAIRNARPELFVEAHSAALLEECKGLLESAEYSLESLDPDPAQARQRDVYQVRAFPRRPA